MSRIKVDAIQGTSGSDTAITLSGANATVDGTLAVTGVHTVGTNAVATSEGGAVTTNVTQGLAKAWVLFNGTGTIASTDSFNISGLTDNGTGNYTVVIDNNMNVSNGFSCIGSDENRGVGETDPSGTGGVTCIRRNTSATAEDCSQISVTVHGDLA